MSATVLFQPGDLVKVRGREWVILPGTTQDLLKIRPLGGSDEDATVVYVPFEEKRPVSATFGLPNPEHPGNQQAALLLRDALRVKLRAGAGPFRSFGNLAFEPRSYQLVPLLMALRLDPIRLLIADDVGIGKTIEAGLIARELLDRGEVERLTVICPPHLCEQWQAELANKFHIRAEVVRTGTASRLERGLRPDQSIFQVYPHTVVSLDYIKSDRRRDDFLRACPELVIVDEAHACVQGNNSNKHQRYQLLKGLAESDEQRHMLFLTATPHSGDDVAFHHLLGLLDSKFVALLEMEQGAQREQLRLELAKHLVQRRRGDIQEWKESVGFPKRESTEFTYPLNGEWGALFRDVLKHARELVRKSEHLGKLEQRMSWWAALALLRCVSSSPAAAIVALNTRLRAERGALTEAQIADELEKQAARTVLDEWTDDAYVMDESVPAGDIDFTAAPSTIEKLIECAEKIRNEYQDPKLTLLTKKVEKLIADGFKPVVFCRYIATAHYIAEYLKGKLSERKHKVIAITGELTSDQREEEINTLKDLPDQINPVLIATDCLSEGINMQELFNAVIHYDLSWNPTRHEQREGRIDRFGQQSQIVRTMMIYGADNPVDGAVLKVIIRKADKIRKELGVSVPLPIEDGQVIEAIMKTVMLYSDSAGYEQTSFDFGETERSVETSWQNVKDKMTNTIFAQRSLKAEDVIPEWKKTLEVLGGTEDVKRFVTTATKRLGAPLDDRSNYEVLTTEFLPVPLQEQLKSAGIGKECRLTFQYPGPPKTSYIHRSHPLVSILSDYIVEQSLESGTAKVGARCGAIFTREVSVKTTVYLLRLRYQILMRSQSIQSSEEQDKYLLSEECIAVAVQGSTQPKVLSGSEMFHTMSLEPGRNMEASQQTRFIETALAAIPELQGSFERVARERAGELLNDHQRIRIASAIKGMRYVVTPSLPVDIIGAYVLVPIMEL